MSHPSSPARHMLWWGRFDPDYARNRVLRQLLRQDGWRITDFRPTISPFACAEATLRRLPTPDLVWVPCFRQRDVAAARRWARSRGVPLVFDPLISAYDKQVFERRRMPEGSARAQALLTKERRQFAAAHRVIADTAAHADFFHQVLEVPHDRIAVVPVGAEEPLFSPAPLDPVRMIVNADGFGLSRPLSVLFVGSFIGLQGPDVIVQAARVYAGPPVTWHLLGEGPLLARCKSLAAGLDNVVFEPWTDYADLPARIHRADILLGVFGTGAKAGRVIPNKVYQALACGRPLITRTGDAYPEALCRDPDPGVIWIEPGRPERLASAVAAWAVCAEGLPARAQAAAASYRKHFSNRAVAVGLHGALAGLIPHSAPVAGTPEVVESGD